MPMPPNPPPWTAEELQASKADPPTHALIQRLHERVILRLYHENARLRAALASITQAEDARDMYDAAVAALGGK